MKENKSITVHGMIIKEGDIVLTTEGRARLDYVGRQAFTNWTLVDQTDRFVFGRPATIEDNCLDKFVIKPEEQQYGS